MTSKQYNILLDNEIIGTTDLEKADPPMGFVGGQIKFIKISSGYDFFKKYCWKNKIKINDKPKDRFITTLDIPNLKVIDQNGNEIKGQGANVEGFDADVFEVYIFGITYPFYEEEFPHHVKAYDEMYK